ncbi:MAG: tetratricopeptide repeat protein, partial [Planctomycetes bacterium]|nr:tetratricopeptide repeat protein [Planctomycetota bacterium]
KTIVDQLTVNAECEYLIGCIATIEGATEKAIHAFEAALDCDPSHVEAAFQLGSLLDRIGDEEMAIESYAVCANTYPPYLPGVLNLGLLYEERGEANAAIDCFRQVLAYNSNNPRAILLLRDATASRTMYYNEDEERNNLRLKKVLQTPVNDFELSVRSRNSLLKMNIFNIGDLISITKTEMLNYKNFGETSLKEIEEMLNNIGLHLGQLRESETRDTRKIEPKILTEKIDKLELSVEASAVLTGLGISRIGDIEQYSDSTLYRLVGSGQNIVQELFTSMASIGMHITKPDFKR